MKRFGLLIIAASLASPMAAQQADSLPLDRELRVFFDCNAFCDTDYTRTETPWVSFVRDRTDADVHVLITSLGTGVGGERYTVNFAGLGVFASRGDTLTYVHHTGDTDEVRRRGLTRVIQLGLAPFVARTAPASRLVTTLEEADEVERAPPASDPWNAWVFDLDANAELDEEQRESSVEWGGSFDASRITSRWKIGASVNADFERSRFLIEGDEGEPDRHLTTLREGYSAGAVAVRSHGAHWGTGAQLSVSASTFSNMSLAVRVGPAVEYSVFPYDEFTRRQLTLQYSVGVSAYRYREVTIFGRLRETRPTHALVVGYDLTQPWGEADLTLETARYIDDASQWRFVFNGGAEIRVARGLSVEFGGGAQLIRDQLSIAARGATPEEVLLDLRDLQTDYRYDVRLGLSYTFGSIYNAVVNPRFGTGPGDILR